MIWWTALAILFVVAILYSSARSHFARAPRRAPELTGPVQGQSWWVVRGMSVADVAERLGLEDLRQAEDLSGSPRDGTVSLHVRDGWVYVLGAPVEDTETLLERLGREAEAWAFSALQEPAWCGWAQLREGAALSAFSLDGELVEGQGLPTPTAGAVRERAAALGLLPGEPAESWLAVLR